MTLEDWLTENAFTYAAFGIMVGTTAPVVWRWAHGQRLPSAKFMTKIVDVTDGEVMPSDFYNLEG